MGRNVEKRVEARTDHKSPVMIKDPKTGSLLRARMVNYCTYGVYFETDGILSPGAEVDIGIENSPYIAFSDIYDCYRAKILWRRELEPVLYKYGYGAKLTNISDTSLS